MPDSDVNLTHQPILEGHAVRLLGFESSLAADLGYTDLDQQQPTLFIPPASWNSPDSFYMRSAYAAADAIDNILRPDYYLGMEGSRPSMAGPASGIRLQPPPHPSLYMRDMQSRFSVYSLELPAPRNLPFVPQRASSDPAISRVNPNPYLSSNIRPLSPQPILHQVFRLSCSSCGVFFTNRGMKVLRRVFRIGLSISLITIRPSFCCDLTYPCIRRTRFRLAAAHLLNLVCQHPRQESLSNALVNV